MSEIIKNHPTNTLDKYTSPCTITIRYQSHLKFGKGIEICGYGPRMSKAVGNRGREESNRLYAGGSSLSHSGYSKPIPVIGSCGRGRGDCALGRAKSRKGVSVSDKLYDGTDSVEGVRRP